MSWFGYWDRPKEERTVAVIRKYFGQDARIEKLWSGWIRVSIAGGWQVEFKSGEGFRSIIGGAEMYRAAILASHELWGYAKVSGSHEHILACIAHGKDLGVPVMPALTPEASTPLAFMSGLLVFTITWLIAMFFLEFSELAAVALFAGIATAAITGPFFRKLMAEAALARAQKYQDIFPDIYGSERKADRELARRKGLL